MAIFALAAARWNDEAETQSEEVTSRFTEAFACLEGVCSPSEDVLRELAQYHEPLPLTAPLERRAGGYPAV